MLIRRKPVAWQGGLKWQYVHSYIATRRPALTYVSVPGKTGDLWTPDQPSPCKTETSQQTDLR